MLAVVGLSLVASAATTTTKRTYEAVHEVEAGALLVNNVQMPIPQVTQFGLVNQDGPSADREFMAMTEQGVHLVDHAGKEHRWKPNYFSVYPTTGGSIPGKAQFVSYSGAIGSDSSQPTKYENGQVVADPGYQPPASVMDVGYSSYAISHDFSQGDQQFFVASPKGILNYLNACPNYKPGETTANTDYVCPRRERKRSSFKFSVIGMMSGKSINSLGAGYVTPSGGIPQAPASADVDVVEIDIAQYKTMIYRTWVDVGGMGSEAKLWIEDPSGTYDGMAWKDIPADYDLSNCTFHTVGPKTLAAIATGVATGNGTWPPTLSVNFDSQYSVGKYTRNIADLWQFYDECLPVQAATKAAGNNPFYDCASDVTGFGEAPDSYVASDATGFERLRKAGTKAQSLKELRQSGGGVGAPDLAVQEVLNMRVTMRPAEFGGRPACTSNPCVWPNAPRDAPWYMLASGHCPSCDGQGPSCACKWAVDSEYIPHTGKTVRKSDAVKCESGSCFFIDFHVDLGGTTKQSRTLFGDPDNDGVHGIGKGTFWLYDPEIRVPSEDPPSTKALPAAAVLTLVLIIICAGVASCCACAGILTGVGLGMCCCCAKKRKEKQPRAEEKQEVEMVANPGVVVAAEPQPAVVTATVVV